MLALSEEVPALHPAYKELHRLIKASHIPDLEKYLQVKSGMTTAEMAQAFAQILINQSYIELDAPEESRLPLFHRLKGCEPELRELTDFLRKELTDYNIGYDFLMSEYDRLERWGTEAPALMKESPLPPVVPEAETAEDFKQKLIEERAERIEDIKLRLGKEKVYPEKGRYSPSGSIRVADIHNADVPDQRWMIDTHFSIRKEQDREADSTVFGTDRFGMLITTSTRTMMYLYSGYLEQENNGFYKPHNSILAGGKVQLTKYERNPFKFALGGEWKHFYLDSSFEDVARVYLSGAYRARKWKGTQVVTNCTFENRNHSNKFLPSIGYETQVRDFPLFFVAEAVKKYEANHWLLNLGFRVTRKRLVYDMIYEDDNEFQRQKIELGALWRF
ncbi:MAG: hypothetical protein PHQ23_04020 [Candidatus Wallbacteria bacterium]|nr:hypothetical protein [Candidatus Wallbacteria bacterium]